MTFQKAFRAALWGIAATITCMLSSGGAFADEPPADAAAVDFRRDILPIFEARCYECHGPTRQRGRMRLDMRSGAFRGDSPENWVIQPGDPAASELFHRISLPAGDFDIMPPEGEPLTAEEIELIRRWIAEGASWPEAAGLDPKRIELRELTDAEQAAEERAIEAIRERGGLAMRIAEDSRGLYINLSLLGEAFGDADLALLHGLEPTLVWLNLSRTAISDEGAKALAEFPELRRLHLNQTSVGDAGVRAIVRLPHLAYLNLYATAVGDDGLRALHDAKQLRSVYLWQTKVSSDAAAALAAALPEARIDLGDYTLAAVVTEAAETAEAAEGDTEPTCCAIALAQGQLCVHTCCVEARAAGELCATCNPAPNQALKRQVFELAEKLERENQEDGGDGDGGEAQGG